MPPVTPRQRLAHLAWTCALAVSCVLLSAMPGAVTGRIAEREAITIVPARAELAATVRTTTTADPPTASVDLSTASHAAAAAFDALATGARSKQRADLAERAWLDGLTRARGEATMRLEAQRKAEAEARARAEAERRRAQAEVRAKAAEAARIAAAAARYQGRNRMWFPALGIDQPVYWFPCSRSRAPDSPVYRWGCAGSNNVYLMAHAWSRFAPLNRAYYAGTLQPGQLVAYADDSGRTRYYRLDWWKTWRPLPSASWAWASQSRSSLTLQTCVGANSELRLFVRFHEVAAP